MPFINKAMVWPWHIMYLSSMDVPELLGAKWPELSEPVPHFGAPPESCSETTQTFDAVVGIFETLNGRLFQKHTWFHHLQSERYCQNLSAMTVVFGSLASGILHRALAKM